MTNEEGIEILNGEWLTREIIIVDRDKANINLIDKIKANSDTIMDIRTNADGDIVERLFDIEFSLIGKLSPVFGNMMTKGIAYIELKNIISAGLCRRLESRDAGKHLFCLDMTKKGQAVDVGKKYIADNFLTDANLLVNKGEERVYGICIGSCSDNGSRISIKAMAMITVPCKNGTESFVSDMASIVTEKEQQPIMIKYLYVEEEIRKSGVGLLLLQATHTFGRYCHLGNTKIFVAVNEIDHNEAKQYYLRLGFVQQGLMEQQGHIEKQLLDLGYVIGRRKVVYGMVGMIRRGFPTANNGRDKNNKEGDMDDNEEEGGSGSEGGDGSGSEGGDSESDENESGDSSESDDNHESDYSDSESNYSGGGGKQSSRQQQSARQKGNGMSQLERYGLDKKGRRAMREKGMKTWTRYDKKYDEDGKAIYKDAMDGKSKPNDANATKQSILAIDMDDGETRNSHKVSRKKQKTVKKSEDDNGMDVLFAAMTSENGIATLDTALTETEPTPNERMKSGYVTNYAQAQILHSTKLTSEEQKMARGGKIATPCYVFYENENDPDNNGTMLTMCSRLHNSIVDYNAPSVTISVADVCGGINLTRGKHKGKVFLTNDHIMAPGGILLRERFRLIGVDPSNKMHADFLQNNDMGIFNNELYKRALNEAEQLMKENQLAQSFIGNRYIAYDMEGVIIGKYKNKMDVGMDGLTRSVLRGGFNQLLRVDPNKKKESLRARHFTNNKLELYDTIVIRVYSPDEFNVWMKENNYQNYDEIPVNGDRFKELMVAADDHKIGRHRWGRRIKKSDLKGVKW